MTHAPARRRAARPESQLGRDDAWEPAALTSVRPELYLSGLPTTADAHRDEAVRRPFPLSETFCRFTDVFAGPESTLDPGTVVLIRASL